MEFKSQISNLTSTNPIDRFIIARLEQEHRALAPEADRPTLIRRLNFGLIGLPPSPQEVDEFVADASSDAYEKLVERLLASPHYGERWGRHWLDVVGYADSNGYFDADSDRPLAWKYRDYVVRAFNADKPFDRFVREQLAGDELAGYVPEGDVTPDMVELLTANHFFRNAPDGTGESDGNPQELRADRYAVLEGNVQILGSAFLGLTVQCARCHDHKFEPLTQAEYYGLQAILKPIYDHDKWLKPGERTLTVGTRAERDENKRQFERFDREMKALTNALEGLMAPFRKLALQENLEKVPEALRARLKAALDTKEKERSGEMKAFLKTNETLVQFKDADLAKRFPEVLDSYLALKDSIDRKEMARPKPLPQIASVIEVTPHPPPHHVLVRGNYGNPGRDAPPTVPAILCAGTARSIAWCSSQAASNSNHKSSGRRTALAQWLASAENPVFARLMVNRIWQGHFGVGLVSSSDNFGLTGARPTHPELLDWLATEFVRSGWSVKAIHRLIVRSAAYRQLSASRDGTTDGDSDDPLLSRFPLRRLDAESLRDAMLSVSGELDRTLGGSPVAIDKTEEGQYVVNEKTPGNKRRSLYIQQKRTKPLTLLDVFDGVRLNPNCAQRTTSTISLQSLALLNSDFLRARSKAFAQRLMSRSTTDPRQRLELAFRWALGRQPRATEISAAEEFLEAQKAPYPADGQLDERIWTDFCQMLFASNSFLYVE